MKKVYYLLITIILIFVLTNYSCKKTSTNLELNHSTFYCGCDSPIIQKLDSISAIMEFDSTDKIYYINLGNPGVMSSYIVCDTNFKEFQTVVNYKRNYYYNIVFSGNVTNYLYDTTMNYINNMYNIKLTKIKNQ